MEDDLRQALLAEPPAASGAESINSSVVDGPGSPLKKPAKARTAPRAITHDLSKDRAAVGFFELFRYSDGLDVFLLVLGFFCATCAGALFPSFSIIFGKLLDSFTDPATLLSKVTTYSFYFLYLGAAALVLQYAQFACFQISSERQITRIRQKFLGSLLRQDMGWFDVNQAGDVSSRLAEDTVVMQTGMGEKLGFTVNQFGQFAFGVGLAFYHGWLLTVVLIGFLPVLGCVAAILVGFLSKTTKAAQDSYAKASAMATEAISAIRIVVAFSGERNEVNRYSSNLTDAERQGIRKGKATGLAIGSIMLTLMVMYGLGLWFGTWLIIRSQNKYCPNGIILCPPEDYNKTTTGGDIITIFFAVIMAGFGLAGGAPNLGLFSSARSAAARIFDVIALEPEIDPASEEGLRPPGPLRGRLEFRNINFAYPSRPDSQVLYDFNLTIEPGSTVALVGSSGSGKSTIMGILQRFYNPQSGTVLVDGHDITKLNVGWLRAHLGIVSQEPALFATTIEENISYGVSGLGGNPSHADIVNAAKMANAHKFISKFPEGYQTMVGERGAQLSGGQKQRVSIARAMLRNPPVLLLDEATSALDTKSERVVQKALDDLIADGSSRTTIVIAHRLSTVKNADVIVVMDRGRIVEVGSHDELMAVQDGKYRRMHDLQSLGSKPELNESKRSAAGVGADEDAASGDEAEAEAEATPVYPSKDVLQLPEERRDEDKPQAGFKRVFAYQRPELPTFILALAGAVINGTIMPMFSVIFSAMTNVFYELNHHTMRVKSFDFFMAFVGIGVVSFFSYFFQIYGMAYVGERLTTRLRKHTYQAIMKQDVGFFDLKENSTGKLTSRLSGDAALVRATTGDRVGTLIQNNVAIIAALIIAFVSCWQLALVVLATFPILVLAGFLQVKMTQTTQRDSGSGQKKFSEAGGFATEALRAIRTVAAFGLQDMVEKRFGKALEVPRRQGIIRGHAGGVGLGLSQFVIFGSYALSFYYGAKLVGWGDTTFEHMMRVFYALTLAGTGVGQNTSYSADQDAAKDAKRSIFSLIDRQSKVDASLPVGIKPATVKGHIQFVHVTFSYPARPHEPVLRNFSLDIDAGSTVALVGPSGSGKSTVVALLQRYYDPDGGTILLDGVDLRNYNVRWLRSYFGLVSQEPALFDETVEYNIAFGRPRLDEPFGELGDELLFGGKRETSEDSLASPAALRKRKHKRSRLSTDQDDMLEAGLLAAHAGAGSGVAGMFSAHLVPEDIASAARTANAAHFIGELDRGFQTRTGDQGTQMSGGQKQRIAIARAVVSHRPVLLLDEATSALDTHSEAIVQSALNALIESKEQQRTSVVIAHRLSTVRNADKIVVVSHGQVAEMGSHDELIERHNGLYRALVRAQDV